MSTFAVEETRIRVRRRAPLRWLTDSREGVVGATLFLLVAGVALLGPLFAGSTTATVGPPGQSPTAGLPLGTDYLGRDVLNRVLAGGASVLLLALVVTMCTYAVGVTIGMVAGMNRSTLDALLMRGIDILMVFPPLMLLLLVVVGAGNSFVVMVIGMTLVLFPGVTRIVRSATLEAGTSGFVEAAVARGETTHAVLTNEILPNIAAPILADVGLRFSYAIVLSASINFLGLGQAPPAANWGLMIAENRPIVASNISALIAPALILALLGISVNLMGDAYARSLGRSRRRR
jgi:ABC-type dipeptide/oligopeptide/nickel transport system permease subunit